MARTTKKTAVMNEAEAVETTPVEAPVAKEVAEAQKVKVAPVEKKYNPEDMIVCRSLIPGELLLPGKNSEILYRWFGVGDTTTVEYRDLMALNASRSPYLYAPYFMIEDEELLSQPRWNSVKQTYDKLYAAQDMDGILDLPPAQLKQMLQKLPASYRKTLAIEVSSRIDAGTYDSINRIKVFDEVMGTDLMCLIN